MKIRNNATGRFDEYSAVNYESDGTYTEVGNTTNAEVLAGTSKSAIVTPASLAAFWAAPMSAGFTVGTEASDTIKVTIQLKDSAGSDMAVRSSVLAYLSNDANGDSICTTAPAGGCAIATDGLLVPVTPSITNAMLLHGNLVVTTNTAKFKTVQTMVYTINGISYTKAATDDLVFTANHVITASKFGIFQIQINAAGTISTKVPGATQAYESAALALAALPAVDAGNVSIGYLAIENNAGDWTANTDDLVASGGDDQTSAAFTDATEITLGGAKMFQLTSEADGDIDVNIINATTTPTYYLVLVLPNGRLAVSGAITFA